MSCRFPGAPDVDSFWKLLREGREALSQPPAERSELAAEGRVPAGYLDRVDRFDPEFFGISPREAAGMDPQQRLALELAWEALEDAGIVPATLADSRTAVYMGAIWDDYAKLAHERGAEGINHTSITGLSRGVIANRVSYALGLRGPSVVVDTGQSSSLVAVHSACETLLSGQASVALAGGVSLNLTPEGFTLAEEFGALSPDGRAYTFDARANGYVRGEGGGLVVLKPLDRALADGDRVYAVIRGGAVNNDGGGLTLTAPRPEAQEEVLRSAYARAHVDPAEAAFVELHGTGTPVGDPVEAKALGAVLGAGRPAGAPLRVGSVKTNIGHLEGAAGIAGLIKSVLCLREGELVPSLNHTTPNPRIPFDELRIAVNTAPTALDRDGGPVIAGVSSFGMGGTNCHLVLSDWPDREPAAGSGTAADGPLPFLVSGRTETALRDQAELLRASLAGRPWLPVADLAHSLAVGRTHFEHRAVLLAADRADLETALSDLAGGRRAAHLVRGEARRSDGTGAGGKLALLFTGQGSQRPGMGRELYAAQPVFAAAYDEVCAQLDPLLGRSLRELAHSTDPADAGLLDRTEYTQPALFAHEVALFRLLEHWGVTPDLLLGHSIGELAAAHVAGVLTLPDAARLVEARGRLMQALPEGGAMVSVQASEEEVRDALGDARDVAVAAVNGPASTVVAGETDAVLAVGEHWRRQGRKTKRLQVSHAFHSPLMEPMLAGFREVAESLAYRQPRIAVVSNLTGDLAGPAEIATPGHWVRHAREAVLFLHGMRTLERLGATSYLEIGPDAVLTAMGRDCLGSSAVLVPAVRRGREEPRTLLAAVAGLHASGAASVAWDRVISGAGSDSGAGARRVPLPTYAFQRERYWLREPGRAARADVGAAGLAALRHPLLGAVVDHADSGQVLLTGRLTAGAPSWEETGLLSPAALAELVRQAGAAAGTERVAELTVGTPPVLPRDGASRIQVAVTAPDGSGVRRVTVHTRPDDDLPGTVWTRHAEGTLTEGTFPQDSFPTAPTGAAGPGTAVPTGTAGPADDADPIPAPEGVRAAWATGTGLLAEIELTPREREDAAHYALHPAFVDRALRLVAPDGELAGTWQDFEVYATGATALRVRITPAGDAAHTLTFTDGAGEPVARIGSLTPRPVTERQIRAARTAAQDALYRLEWRPVPTPRGAVRSGVVVVGSDGFGLPAALTTAHSGVTHLPDVRSLLGCVGTDGRAPGVVLLTCADEAGDATGAALADAAAAAAARTAEAVGAWLADERSADARLVVVTRSAVAAGDDGLPPDPVSGAVRGLVRSLQHAHPGRIGLLDLGAPGDSLQAVPLALGCDEPELALRGGRILAPRLVRALPPAAPVPVWETGGSVLVTGSADGRSAALARHLVTEHHVRHLLLAGPAGTWSEETADGLRALGAEVTPAPCDLTDRHALAGLLAAIPPAHPLTGVVHDVAATGPEADVRARTAAAVHLDELTRAHSLSAFVLLTPAEAVLGGPDGADCAAGAFAHALAARRQAEGGAAQAVARGPWEGDGSPAPTGVLPLPAAEGLTLLDLAPRVPAPLVVAVRPDRGALRGPRERRTVSAVLRGFAPAAERRPAALPALLPDAGRPAARPETGASAADALVAGLTEAEAIAALTELVRGHVAAVLEHGSAAGVDTARSFKDLGFDSLMTVELRNLLVAGTGLALPTTLVYDHPTPDAVVRHLWRRTGGGRADDAQDPAAPSGPPAGSPSGDEDDDPIAIVAMSCRFPGGVDTPEQLWRAVADGADLVGAFPTDRGWDLEGLYDPEGNAPGKHYVREGGFLDATGFDADFFGVNPREALAMDPQQRLFLEASWEVFERAGIDPKSLAGSRTGVFVGTTFQDYGPRLDEGTQATEGYLMTGSTPSVASGRIAYTFGLEGPAITVDTACSASLVALHMACRSIRTGECTMAVAGGVTVMSTPGIFVELTRQRALSADGRCKSFSDTADGTGWSEGVGVLLVERLSEARRRGHRVLALVRGSAINQDGASNGLTAPNGVQQQQVIMRTLADAGLSTADVDAVEAHGTGTRLGDPIEAGALLATYGQDRPADRPLWLGSVKSNIGHTQSAAGVAGVIKMVQAMRHGVLPRTLHVEAPSTHVDWSAGAVELLTEQRPWPETGRPRRAGVSSFGISGTNAHVILEQAPEAEESTEDETAAGREASALPLVLSAKTGPALRELAARMAAAVEDGLAPEDAGRALTVARAVFDHRAVAVGHDRLELASALRAVAEDRSAPGAVAGTAEPLGRRVFVFPGQGSQWAGMAVELLDADAGFAGHFREVASAVERCVEWRVEDVLRGV
ncbi:beta-ketoacyl synthase N-terminal-like domain-containing protein, partial [Streptomyces sp. NPDC014656]|uniref:beta-ketoacyl synthase N-terminal-like domain-containing protein n=1 Tax=Streptomyces sp. NPDC014656 TaxID=3364878 RepID=UPI003701087A